MFSGWELIRAELMVVNCPMSRWAFGGSAKADRWTRSCQLQRDSISQVPSSPGSQAGEKGIQLTEVTMQLVHSGHSTPGWCWAWTVCVSSPAPSWGQLGTQGGSPLSRALQAISAWFVGRKCLVRGERFQLSPHLSLSSTVMGPRHNTPLLRPQAPPRIGVLFL